jgi:hypothetical protein
VSRSRVAVLVAAAALFTTAEAVQAAALGVELPLAPGQAEIGGVGAQIRTPVADVDVRVSPARVSAAVTAPPPSVEVPLPAPPASPAEPPAHGASKGSAKEPKAHRAPTSRPQHQVRPAASPKPVTSEPPSMEAPAASDEAGGLVPRSFLPEAAFLTDESVTATAAGSAGATAALAGLVLVAIGLLSWIALQRPARLSPPLLSFALQRPG